MMKRKNQFQPKGTLHLVILTKDGLRQANQLREDQKAGARKGEAYPGHQVEIKATPIEGKIISSQ